MIWMPDTAFDILRRGFKVYQDIYPDATLGNYLGDLYDFLPEKLDDIPDTLLYHYINEFRKELLVDLR